MGKWGKLCKGKCSCNVRRTWSCKSRKRSKKSYEKERTENELWQEYYAPYLHFMPFQEICPRLETSPAEGLSQEVAATRLKRNGRNTLSFPKKPMLLAVRYLWHCFSVIGLILLLGALSCFLMHHHEIDLHPDEITHPKFLSAAWLLLIIFLFAGLMPVLYGEDIEELQDAVYDMMPMYCTVIREGKKEIILTQDVVIGDIVPISYGQRLPADLRFFSTSGLEIDNVALTGSSEPWQISLLASDEKRLSSISRVEHLNNLK